MDLLKDYTGQNLNFVTSKKLLYKINGFQKSKLILLQKKDCLNLARENTTAFRFVNLYHTRENEVKIVM